ncbi:MAG: glycosyltransferase family 2 protein [Bacteroidales bacterium]|nr:glycosyltransferase family 2 protein [Bacteroidales bacterium]
MSRLLVIVVTFNGMEWLERCLGSVASSSVPADLFVVDNNSSDGSPDYIASHYPSARLIRSSENLGFARANDLGLRFAVDNGYDYVYLLNQDAWVFKDTFERLINAFSGGGWGIISPLQLKPDLTPDKRFKRHFHGSPDPSDEVQTVRFVMAAHWMVSSSCLAKVGLFSPAFRHYGEDNNFCDRVRYHGFGIGVLTSAKGIHDRQARKKTKPQRINQNCQYSKVRLSDPNSSFLIQALWQPVRQALMAVRWLSFLPVMNIPALVRDYSILKDLRERSKGEGAFLTSDNH